MEEDERGKLFVGGLSWETTQENLQRYFARYGDIIDCVVMKNNDTGRSRGFGFVTFSDPTNVALVLKNGPHTLDGRTIDPKPCNPRTLQKPKKGGGYKIFLGGLPSNVTETDLRTFFGRYGKVTEVVIMYDQEKKKSRGFGFLSFEDEGSVECVTNERYINLNGKQVEIKKAEPRDGGGYNKMSGDPNQWSHHQGAPLGMIQGPNGQINAPQMNMPMGAPNMMPGYQSWGTSPQQQGYGYGGSNAQGSYQGWGAPPGPQGPPPQWSNYNPQQSQGYNNYDNIQYNSTSGSVSTSWSWLPPNNAGGAAGSGPDIYSRSQWAGGAQSTTAPISGMPRTGPGNSASKSGSEYDYSGYGSGSGYDYEYNNYSKDQNSTYAQRSAYGNDTTTQPQYPPSQAV